MEAAPTAKWPAPTSCAVARCWPRFHRSSQSLDTSLAIYKGFGSAPPLHAFTRHSRWEHRKIRRLPRGLLWFHHKNRRGPRKACVHCSLFTRASPRPSPTVLTHTRYLRGFHRLAIKKPPGTHTLCALRSLFARVSRRIRRKLSRSSLPLHTSTRYLRGFHRKTLLPPEGRRQPCSRSLAIYEGFVAKHF